MEALMWMVWLVVGCQALSSDITDSPSATLATKPDAKAFVTSADAGNSSDQEPPPRGKRSSEIEDMLEELATKPKRDPPGKMRFNSWGGKRTRIVPWTGRREGAKRKFNSWGGKRSDDSFDYDQLSEDKRAKFNSWGGKRAKFNSWGGKRSDYEGLTEEEKRAKFNSWGGKRGGLDYDDSAGDDSNESFWRPDDSVGKRAKFNSWGGKRDDSATWEDDKRAKFNSWGGKRTTNDTSYNGEDFMIVKRAYPATSLKRKQIFSSWGGKRTARSASPGYRLRVAKDRAWGTLLRPIRRGPDFYAWGGKRSV